MAEYNFGQIESKWQKIWEDMQSGKAEDFSEKMPFYSLIEFPYPSGAGLHVGHCMMYSATDAHARMMRMKGYNVMYPIGWDAFGLPTENYAIKNKMKPADATAANIETFKRQMKSLGYSFDWSREINTTDPEYYRWTQWIFLQFYKHAMVGPTSSSDFAGQSGKLIEIADDDTTTPRMAFQAEMPVNWCPSCKTILANEEVINGKCERCGAQSEKRVQKQWMLRITAYADRLIKDLDTVDYLEKIKSQQVNWIGKSEGTKIKFEVRASQLAASENSINSEKINKMLGIIDRVSKAFAEKNIKIWFNGTWGVIGYYKSIFDEPDDVDCGVLEADFEVARKIVEELGFSKIEDKENGEFRVSIYNTEGITYEIGTFKEDLGENVATIEGHNYPIPDAKWLADCYRITASKERRRGKNDLQRAEFLDSIGEKAQFIEVFTTRADTLFGCTYIVIAPESNYLTMIKDQILNIKEVEEYINQAKKKSDLERTELQKEKTGVRLEGVRAINLINNEEVDIYVADYVLATYGTGAVMAVPAHDERDWEFAKKYNITIKQTIAPYFADTSELDGVRADKPTVERRAVLGLVKHWSEDKYYLLNWEQFGWHTMVIGGVEQGESDIDAVSREVREETGYQDIKSVKKIDFETINHFFARHKDVNRYGWFNCYLVELADDQYLAPELEEVKNHTGKWYTPEEADQFINLSNHIYYWNSYKNAEKAFVDYGVLINSGEFNNLSSQDAKIAITEKLKQSGVGDFVTNFKIRDWIFSRQHYWGEPIPIVHCEKCGIVPLPEEQLPLTLPDVENYQPTDTGESPLAAISDWVNTKCPKCGGNAKRETDTMPNWAGSSWYSLAYAMNKDLGMMNFDANGNIFADKSKELDYWMPVDLYNGGMEHTTLHLLYSRFWHKFLFDLGVVSSPEPYKKRIAHGMILGPDGQKMSKSRGNVINPDETVEKFGADTLRAYIMFIGPYDQDSSWSTTAVQGVHRFLKRVWNNIEKISEASDEKELLIKLNQTINGVTDDIENYRMNTVIAKLMEFNNVLEKVGHISRESFGKFLTLLSVVAPHIASELWENGGFEGMVVDQAWPIADDNYLIADTVEMVVQVNGKVRDKVQVDANISDEELRAIALDSEKVKFYLEGKEIVRVIIVPKKLVSIVAK